MMPKFPTLKSDSDILNLKQKEIDFNKIKFYSNSTVNHLSQVKNFEENATNNLNYNAKLPLQLTDKSSNGKSSKRGKYNNKSSKSYKPKKLSYRSRNLLEMGVLVRRSERYNYKAFKEEEEQCVLRNIINSKEEGMRVINTIDKGRGVESTVSFKKDCFIVEYAGDLLSEKEAKEREIEYQKDPSKGSFVFHFKYNDTRYCVDATEESGRFGRLLNHSKTHPNCYVKIIAVKKIPRLAIFAKRDIQPGEEMVYDYGDRDKASIEANPWLKY